MPRVDPSEFERLELGVRRFVDGHALHDVWRVDLGDAAGCTIPGLRALLTPERRRSVHPVVRALFALRSWLGRIFRLDPDGAWKTLDERDDEGAYRVVNATVDAILVVALSRRDGGTVFYWATYLKPVGRITPLYMALIDPFRRAIVYPGLERWLVRAVAGPARETA